MLNGFGRLCMGEPSIFSLEHQERHFKDKKIAISIEGTFYLLGENGEVEVVQKPQAENE